MLQLWSSNTTLEPGGSKHDETVKCSRCLKVPYRERNYTSNHRGSVAAWSWYFCFVVFGKPGWVDYTASHITHQSTICVFKQIHQLCLYHHTHLKFQHPWSLYTAQMRDILIALIMKHRSSLSVLYCTINNILFLMKWKLDQIQSLMHCWKRNWGIVTPDCFFNVRVLCCYSFSPSVYKEAE